jgi:hypothetical protein
MNESIPHSIVLQGHTFPGSKYSNQQRIEAVVYYMVHGSLTKTSKACGIPLTTLHDWKQTEWWPELSEQVRREKESEFQAGLSRIVTSAIGEIEDRVQHGDVKLVKVKDGYEERRVPVSAKDATVIAGISYDKLRLSLNLPTSITSSQKTLNELSDEFREIAKNYRRDVIDVEAS